MLGCVAAVIAIVSPSQLNPPVIHKTSISGMGADFLSERPADSIGGRNSFQCSAQAPHRKITRPSSAPNARQSRQDNALSVAKRSLWACYQFKPHEPH